MKNLLLLTVFLSVFKLNAQWVDIASTVGGITPTTNMGKPCVFDFNNDNYPDLFVQVLTNVVSPYTKYWRLYKNNGNSTFSDVTTSLGIPSDLSTTVGFIDYNGDGFKDFYYITPTGFRIYKNNDGVSFTDVSSALGITTSFFTTGEITSPIRIFDYDLDGDLDLLYTRTISGSNTLTAIVNGGTTFSTKVNVLTGISGGISGGINFSFFDMDNDGDFDLVFDATTTNQYANGTIALYRKEATGYVNSTSGSGLNNGQPGEISTIDINQDGNLDIVKGGADCCTSTLYRVFIGNGAGIFTDQTTSYAISNGGYKYVPTINDFDNDTDFDFSWSGFTSTGAAPFRLYANNGTNGFTESAATYGLNYGVTSGGVPIDDGGNASWLDIDNDGDLDIIINRDGWGSTSQTGNVWVKKNPLQGNYINIKLNGCSVNKRGIGAKIKLIVGAKTKWLYYGTSTDGNSSNGTDLFHFGLGNSTNISSIVVYWPNNTLTSLSNVSANQLLVIGGNSNTVPPTGGSTQTFCAASTVANLTATGSFIKWYSAAIGGNTLAATTALTNGTTYYASQTIDGCESSIRLAVTVTISISPTPTGSAIQYFCGESTIASFVVSGPSIKWYTTSTGGTALPLTTSITSGSVFYASSTTNNCESLNRFAVQGFIKNTTLTATSNSICAGVSVTLSANDSTSTATTYLWSTGETSASISASPQDSTTYWADIISNGSTCRKYSTIIVNNSSISASNTNLCQPEMITISANVLTNSTNNSCSSAVLPSNLQTNLLAWYTFCGNVNDQTLNSHNGTVTGTSTYINDRNNNPSSAFFFNGATKIQIPHAASLNAFPFSVSVWVKSSDANPGHIINKYENATWNGWTISADPKGTGCYLRNRTSAMISQYDGYPEFYTTQPLNDNTWHNLVFVADQYSGRIYLDGALQDTQLWRGTPGVANSSWPMIIGYYAHTYAGIGTNTGYFNGASDDIGVWGRALTAIEVQQLYSNQSAATFLWSTGETSQYINPTPTQTTTYWVDITINGITCRKNITITVNPNIAPTGLATQTFCASSTIANLVATGTNIQWYETAIGGTPLTTTTELVNGTIYYASQTINGCETIARLAVTASINNTSITASATTICGGTSVTLTASGASLSSVNNCSLPSVLQNGLQAFYPFCGNSNDSSGNNLNGTVSGATLTYDRMGTPNSAYSFTTNQQITIPNTATMNTYPLTVSLWYNANSLPNGVSSNIFSKYVPAAWNGFEILLSDCRNVSSNGINYNNGFGVPSWYLRSGTNKCIGYYGETPFLQPNISANTWYNYVFVLDSTGGKIYVNGQLVGSHAWTGIPGASTNNYLWKIGGLYNTWFNGKIDDVGIWNRALNPQEVQQLYTPASTFLWSTGETTTTINPTPTTTTTYWCDVTTNGVTCRKEMTITVNDPQITASATTVCSGNAVILTVSTPATPVANNCTLPTNLQNGLVGYWPFCGNANDESGNANNGTVNGASLTTDRFGNTNNAYLFLNGNTNSYISLGNNIHPNQFTYSIWAYKTNIRTNGFNVLLSSYFNNFGFEIQNSQQNLGTVLGNNNSWSGMGKNQNNLNNWKHIVVSYDGNIAKMFLDGIQILNSDLVISYPNISVGDILSMNNFAPGTNTLFVGDRPNDTSNQFNYEGILDDIAIYNRALSPSEITQLYSTNQITYLWSTGETTATINPTPTVTTTYWVDVTINGVTCHKEITIVVNSISVAPTGNATQTYCASATVANLVATGTTIQWYASATGGTALASTTELINGNTYYASQTVDNGCESTSRFAVVVALNNPTITASATSICSGTTVTLSALDINNNQQVGNKVAQFSNNVTNKIDLNYNSQSIPTNNFSYEFWFNTNRTITLLTEKTGGVSVQAINGQNFAAIPAFYNTPNFRGTGVSVGTNGISVIEHCGNFIDARLTYASTLTGWHHCAVVYQNNGFNLYLDSVLVGTRANGSNFGGYGTQYASMGLLQSIGSGYPGFDANDNYTGKLDEYRQWSVALNASQVSQIYNRKLQSTDMAECNLNLTFDQGSLINSSAISSGLTLLNTTLPSFSFDNSFQIGGFTGATISAISNTNLNSPSSSTYLWSTGETTATINPAPNDTTTYWVEVTTNGVTCYKEITIVANKPTNLSVSGITNTSATFGWVNGLPSDNAWQILLVPSSTTTPPALLPPANPTLTSGMILTNVSTPSPFTINALTPATIYYYYIRTICSSNNNSSWAGPFVFNTSTCATADKCAYKFILRDSGANGWNGGTMQVRQNGIVVATIGATLTGAGPTTVSVLLCNTVPFDLYWDTTGTAPAEIGLSIQNPFLDVLYTKLPGEGLPQSVLFNSVANCTPPTCQKPTSLIVTSITQTTATLGWTEIGTATQWQVYVVTAGSPAPINGSPLSNVVPNTVANTNPFLITGLNPSTPYTFYVRSICSSSDMSTWTLLTPVNFTTKSANADCATAIPICSASPTDPFIYQNTTGVPSTGQIACLGSNPNPSYFTIHVGQTGPLNFSIVQNTAFTNGQPSGTNIDVDFVAWGPFTSPQSCDQIVFADCPTCPFSNVGSTFYPFGNILDCSYSGSYVETLTIPNAQSGEYYVILITNFNGTAGFTSFVQTNTTVVGAGTITCCDLNQVATFTYPQTTYCQNSNNPFPIFTSNGVAGVFSSSPGLYLDPISGIINLAMSAPGFYVITNTIAAANGCPSHSATAVVEIFPQNYSEIYYPGSPFCTSSMVEEPVQIWGNNSFMGGYFTSYPSGLALNPNTGAIIPSLSTPGNYFVEYMSFSMGGCPSNNSTTYVVISAMPIAVIEYPGSPYCSTLTGLQPVVISGTDNYLGGYYSSISGLTINAITGDILPSTSTPGNYVVNYTIPASQGCPSVFSSAYLEIVPLPSAPSGTSNQSMCSASTVANIAVTGTNIQWYDTAIGGMPLATTTELVNGTTYYASQTAGYNCESTTRLPITVAINNTSIIASETLVCNGSSVQLTASTPESGITSNCELPNNLQNGLIGFWPFCGNANDVSGNGHNGTVNGNTLSSDRFGNANSAYSFDGISNYIEIPNHSELNSYPMTVSFWLKSNTVNSGAKILNKVCCSSWNGWDIECGNFTGNISGSNSNFHFEYYNTVCKGIYQSYCSPIPYPTFNVFDNTWRQCVFVVDNSGAKVYWDGILMFQQDWDGPPMGGSNQLPLIIGRYVNGGHYFTGMLDDISIWNRALTPQEILQIHNVSSTTYLWSTGETTATINPTPTATTTYWCDVTTNGETCHKEITITVGATPAPTGYNNQFLFLGATLADLVVVGQNIQWYATPFFGTPLPLNTPIVNGTTYYASQTIDGCESPYRLPVIAQTSLGSDSFGGISLQYSPNPVEGLLYIKANEVLKKVSIYNLLGQIIYQQRFNANEIEANLNNFATGTYMVIVESDDRKETFKIIKK